MSKLDKLKTLIPLENTEQEAQNQIFALLDKDFVTKMVCLPDLHTGYTAPIGSVILTDGVISPAMVGYDIGCGMIYADTTIPVHKLLKTEKDKKEVFDKLYEYIPTGFDSHKRSAGIKYNIPFKSASNDKHFTDSVQSKVNVQLGTLGGGNHFIEIGENREGNVCITIHSGSRNVGHQIASFYMDKGDFLDLDSLEGQAYLADMNYALDFALNNRISMLLQSLTALGLKRETNLIMAEYVNENHNHAVVIEDGVLHRKGATPADVEQKGIIPGSMGTGVYITNGLGNKEYLCSASHGAGRKMSRNKAKKTLDINYHKQQMKQKGIVARTDKKVLDESDGAYKDVHKVVKMQEGVVIDVLDHIKPLINVKG